MRPEDLFSLLQREPCPRLKLHVSNGPVFEIEDADMVVLGMSAVELLVTSNDGVLHEAVISLTHIVWIDVLTA